MADMKLDNSIKKLGFGLMRLPEINGNIDIDQVKEMVDVFLSKGFSYFDTAYVYNNGASEAAIKTALVDRYPRESFQLATKLPMFLVKSPEDCEGLFNTSLERTGAGYFDFYLLHALGGDSIKRADDFGCWDFIAKKKEAGLIRHIGFSFHGTPEALDDLLTRHPEAEFVQLQINYMDWESPNVQSRAVYEVAQKHQKPIIIMEPVKGGALATSEAGVNALFKTADPNMSVASWAVRFAASLPGVFVVLSGMSTLDQVNDNTSFMTDFIPLNEEEKSLCMQAADVLNSIIAVPCTGCKYCVDSCPSNIRIPNILSSYNDQLRYQVEALKSRNYGFAVGNGGKASDCLQCRTCESHCPQHIEISAYMAKAAELFE